MGDTYKPQKAFYEANPSSPKQGGTRQSPPLPFSPIQLTMPPVQVSKPDTYIDPSSENDWEIINPADYEKPEPSKCGVSASGSFKIGNGEKQREVFSFHFHTGG